MRKYSIVIILLISTSLSGTAQSRVVGAIGFYNVENLFDLVDDPDKNDDEFTPEGDNEWDRERLDSKLTNISRVISEMARGVDILGLSEVESLAVLTELVAMPSLQRHNYQIVHQESPDWRGIDCALLYKPDRFQLLDFQAIPFPDEDYTTRDILHVEGIYFGDTLHVFVNHWPSRRGGKADKRNAAAERLRQEVDELLAENDQAKIIIMGDLNDDPNNKSVKKILRAVDFDKVEEDDLYNPSAAVFKQGLGTLYYNGAWNLFDQIIVSQGLMEGAEGVTYQPESFSIFGPPWMRNQTGQFAGGPFRSFSYGVYQNGFSDHFPTYILLQK